MRGHFISGTRKLNRHYQSGGDNLKPWKVVGEPVSEWISLTAPANKYKYKLDGIEFGTLTPAAVDDTTIVVPFKFKCLDHDTRIYFYSTNILTNFPLSGEINIYSTDDDSTVGTLTLVRVNGSRWKIKTNYNKPLYGFSFQFTTTDSGNFTPFISFRKAVT